MKPLYKTWLARIHADDGMTNSHALTLGHRLTDPTMRRSSLTYAEWTDLARIATDTQPHMHQADTERGLAWLRSLAYTPTGRERKHNPFGSWDLAVLDNAVGIRLAGYTAWQRAYWTYYRPVYRVQARDGAYLDYAIGSTRSDAIGGNGGDRIECRPAIERRWG